MRGDDHTYHVVRRPSNIGPAKGSRIQYIRDVSTDPIQTAIHILALCGGQISTDLQVVSSGKMVFGDTVARVGVALGVRTDRGLRGSRGLKIRRSA